MQQTILPRPVTIISGFLGAGKTTFLNALVHHKKSAGIKTIIIENEYGQEGIDAELVIGADSDIFEFNNGCLCCDLNEDLFDLLSVLWQRKEQWDELIIETTGIADPAAVAVPFLTNPSIAHYYQLERVICVVDAGLVSAELEETEEARKQIAFGDILLINKTDMVRPAYVDELKQLLGNINPFAKILTGDHSSGYPLSTITGYIRDMELPAADDRTHTHQKHDHTHHKHHSLVSHCFYFDEPFDRETFEHRMLVLLNLQGKDIYRVKGIICVQNSPDKLIVQSVSNYFAVTEGKKWETRDNRQSKIIFIGRNIQADIIQKILHHCLSIPAKG